MTDKKIDTGTGGFPIDGKVVTYDVGVEQDVPDDVSWDSGQVKVDQDATRDLSKATKLTLGKYLSETTRGNTPSVPAQAREKGNRYPVSLPMPGFQDISVTNTDGTPIGPQLVPAGSFEPYLGPKGELLNQTPGSRATLPRPTWAPSTGMLRDQSDTGEVAYDGNNLLKDAVDNEKKSLKPDAPVTAYSNALFNNRWSSDNQFGAEPSREGIGRKLAAVNYVPGESYKKDYYVSDSSNLITQKQLAAVGNVLMARASTELNSTESGLDPTTEGFIAGAALLPGLAQLSLAKASEPDLRASAVLENLDLIMSDGDDPTAGVLDEQLISIAPGGFGSSNLQSWGALNNPYDQFSGFGALGMQILAIAFVLAINLVPAVIEGFAKFRDGTAVPKQTLDGYGRRPIGKWRTKGRGVPNLSIGSIVDAIAKGDLDWTDLIGFSPTVYPLGECLTVGVAAFYGLAKDDTGAAGVGLTLLQALAPSGPEAYTVFSRAIFRSFVSLTDRIVALGQAAAASAVGFLQALLAFIEYLRESKVMRALNTFAQLGNQSLSEVSGIKEDEGNNEYPSPTGTTEDKNTIGFGQKKSRTDSLFIDAKSAVTKSRLIDLKETEIKKPGEEGFVSKPKYLRHAWSSFRSPDMLLMPLAIQQASNLDQSMGATVTLPQIEFSKTGDSPQGTRNGDILSRGVFSVQNEDRIRTNLRYEMEQRLDAEYMPFYFHDVRTNEIVSFHAFLMSLNDSFTAAYDTQEAFGRVEPIKTYKGTTRSVSVGFMVAALGKDDFDYMWLKINKLATLVYPQFTLGKFAESNSFKVTVPFSQQIAAAPLVRLRIGDLIQSNYSRFNLARLFGYTSGEDELTGESDPSKKKEQKGSTITGILEGDGGGKDYMEVYADIVEASKKKVGNTFYVRGVADFTGLNSLNNSLTTRTIPDGLLFKVKSEKGDKITGEIIVNPEVPKPTQEALQKKFGPKAEKKGDQLLGAVCAVDASSLSQSEDTRKKNDNSKDQKLGKSKPARQYQAAVEDFMRRDKNSVVRTFESSGGRGLPGFIESMTFDWYGGTTWEIDEGSRAPKMCKVNITFSPFHDITPGIDSKGYNRAPIYPLGPHRNKFR